jgi:hypothetical protein
MELRGQMNMSIRVLRPTLFVVGLLSLGGCVSTQQKASWDHYDECSSQTKTFTAMVECGKQKRMAYCQAEGECSSHGNSVIQYADTLSQSVARKEMTETEAQRRWIEFKTAQINAVNQNQATLAGASMVAASASGPRTCTTIGSITNCF